MKVYRAETGQTIHWHSNPTRIKTLSDLKQELEQDSGVPVSEQILMTSFGKLVRQENIVSILEATGQHEYIIFCFDRRYLSVHEEDIEALLDAETPPLEPKLPLFDGPLALKQLYTQLKNSSLIAVCHSFVSVFASFDSYSQSLMKTATAHTQLSKNIVDEHKFQSMALNVALTNLEDHRKLSEASIHDFVLRAEAELERQQALLNSVDHDLHILRHVRIHPSITAALEPNNNQQQQLRLLDFIDIDHINQVRSDTQILCDFLVDQSSLFKKEVKQMQQDEKEFHARVAENSNLHALDATLSDIQIIHQKTHYYRDKVKRDLRRIYEKVASLINKPVSSLFDTLSIHHTTSVMTSSSSMSSSRVEQDPSHVITSSAKRTFDAFLHLAEIHVKEYLPKMSDYEHSIRQKTSELIVSKRGSISMFIHNMAVVSEFQRHVGHIQPTIENNMSYLDEFKQKYKGKDLESLRDVLFSYGAVMIEFVRRKEFASLLVNNADLIANTLAQYRTQEEARRDHFRQTITPLLPFKLTMNKPPLQCDISVHGDQDKTDLQKQDISEFISIINQVYSRSPHQLASSMQHLSLSKRGLGSSNEPDEQFLDLLKNMIQDMNSMKTDFLVYLKTNFTDMETVKQDPSKVQRSLSPPLLRPTVVEESQKPSLASSPASSIFSVIEDDKKLVLENKDLKSKLTTAEEEVVSLEQKNQEQADEISQLKETIKLLENERDEFESHRKSFLNELKNKDKTADFRIASVEEDFNAKLNDLQYELEEERRMKKNLEIEHQSEMKTLQTELEAHTKTLEEIQAIHRSESEGHTRTIRQLQQDMEKHSQLKEEHTELQRRFDQLCQDMDTVKQKLEAERSDYESQLSRLQTEIEEKEKAAEEIKAIQQQTRVMVKRAQDDWESKNEELQNIKRDHDSLCQTVRSLLKRFMPQGVDQELNQASLQSYLGGFKEQLEVFEREYDVAKEDLYITMQQLSDLVRDYTNLVEVHNEWKVIASRMAEKLEDFRKNMIFEIVNQLQLPMDEEELNILQKKLTPNEDDTAVWNQILQLTSSINTQKFVLKVHKRVKDNYEQAKQYKKEYRSIKEKYNRLCTSYCEKIAFRNFQTGDIALFLPTRNASGKPWAAFNINAPHYFLKSTDNMASQMQSRDWIVARIVSITEYTANAQHPESNPYGLADGIKYYFIEAENWRHSKQHSKKRQLVQDNGLASVMIPPDDPYQQQKRPSLGPSSSSSFVHSYSS